GGHLLRPPKPPARFGSPASSICTGGVNPPGIKMFAPRSCLAPLGGGSLPLAKEAERERRLFGLQLLHPGLGGHLLRPPKPPARFGNPASSICTGGVNPPGIKMFAPRACLTPLCGGSLPLAKEAERERRLFGLQLLHPGLGGHLLRPSQPPARFGNPGSSICTGRLHPPRSKIFAPRTCREPPYRAPLP